MDKLLDVNVMYAADKDLKKEDVEVVLKWCEQERHFPKVSELQAALALHSCFYKIEVTKSCLENYFTIRALCPEMFSQFDPTKNDLLKQQMDVHLFTHLPGQTAKGDNVILLKLWNTNPDVYNLQIGSKLFDMQMMLKVHTEKPTNGFVVVLDMKGGVFMHLAKVNFAEFKKFIVYVQSAMPIRLKEIHFINVVPFMDRIMSMLKPFINKELFDKIIIHSNNDNLYKYISKDSMPEEYGGKADSLRVLFERSKKAIYDNTQFFDWLEKQVSDENRRVGPRTNTDNLFGFDGTFKKLNVD